MPASAVTASTSAMAATRGHDAQRLDASDSTSRPACIEATAELVALLGCLAMRRRRATCASRTSPVTDQPFTRWSAPSPSHAAWRRRPDRRGQTAPRPRAVVTDAHRAVGFDVGRRRHLAAGAPERDHPYGTARSAAATIRPREVDPKLNSIARCRAAGTVRRHAQRTHPSGGCEARSAASRQRPCDRWGERNEEGARGGPAPSHASSLDGGSRSRALDGPLEGGIEQHLS